MTGWLRRRGEYPGPGVPVSSPPAEVDPEIADLRSALAAATRDRDYACAERDAARQFAAELAEERNERIFGGSERDAEMARLRAATESLQARVSTSPDSVATQDRRNAVALSDRNAELRRDLDDLTERYAALERAAAPYGVVAERAS